MLKEITKKIAKWLLIPLILFGLSIILSVIFFLNNDLNPNILLHNESTKALSQKNNVISGKFRSFDNYLGIINLRFDQKKLIQEDSIFRIKEISEKNWYYTNFVSARQYSNHPLYSFGFPVIKMSKDKIYQFEIKLISGKQGLFLSRQEPVLTSIYVYPREVLLGDFLKLSNFITNKINYYIGVNDSWKVIFIYSLPLFFYFFYFVVLHRFVSNTNKFLIKQLIKNFYSPVKLIILTAIFIDIFVLKEHLDTNVLFLSIAWIITLAIYRMDGKYSFLLALLFLFFCPFLMIASMNWVAEKSAIWAYIMLTIGTLQSVIESTSIFEKVANTKLVFIFVKLIQYVFDSFDNQVMSLSNKIKATFISIIIYVFKSLPKTFFDWVIFIVKLLILLIVLSIIFLTTVLIAIKISNKIQIINHKKIRLSLNPIIETLEPQLVYKATKVVIYGKGFGWNTKMINVFMDGKKIDTSLWTDSKIIFSVPLNWSTGNHKIWIEKIINWDGKEELIKTQEFNIKVLQIGAKFTENDKLYFEQMKTWRLETKEVNGYK